MCNTRVAFWVLSFSKNVRFTSWRCSGCRASWENVLITRCLIQGWNSDLCLFQKMSVSRPFQVVTLFRLSGRWHLRKPTAQPRHIRVVCLQPIRARRSGRLETDGTQNSDLAKYARNCVHSHLWSCERDFTACVTKSAIMWKKQEFRTKFYHYKMHVNFAYKISAYCVNMLDFRLIK